MICVITNGPHANEHFKFEPEGFDDFVPPGQILIWTRTQKVTVHTLDRRNNQRLLPRDHFGYKLVKGIARRRVEMGGLVRFIQFNESLV